MTPDNGVEDRMSHYHHDKQNQKMEFTKRTKVARSGIGCPGHPQYRGSDDNGTLADVEGDPNNFSEGLDKTLSP